MIYSVNCDNCPYAARYIKKSTADERAGTHAHKLRHRAVVSDGFQETAHDHRHDQTSPEVQP